MKRLFLIATCLASVCTWADPPVEVVGLFAGRAYLRTTAGDVMLRTGETTRDGVTLLSASPDGALVEYEGEEFALGLSDRIGTQFKAATRSELSISRDQMGQYRVRGAINGHMVGFLVDTGASVIAMSAQQARAIGIEYERTSEKGSVVTAQGETESYFVILDDVAVGGIKARNVRAAIIEGSYPVEILLGMTFLNQVSMREQDGVMTLVQKY